MLAASRKRSGNHKHQVFNRLGSEEYVSLKGKKGLIVGIANRNSIAFGCAEAFRCAGAELAVTYRSARAEPFVRPLAEQLGSPIVVPCDVSEPGQLEDVFSRIRNEWGRLDFLLHSIAYAPKQDLHSRVIDCSQAGFTMAMDVSCHSFIRMARLAEPLMTNGGCLLTVTFYGAEKVVEEYNLMGPVKSALESCVRYMAAELGPKRIRVHALSPGPLKTRAASGIERFDELLDRARARAAEHRLVGIEDVGNVAAFLVSDGAAALTGNIEYVDAGYHIIG
jgi:enoyl-[acyl-carrier protein] reductase I